MPRTLPLLAALLTLTAGCAPEYEWDRPGTWKPTGANDANLQAMVADPQDLSSGRGMLTNRASGPARAVTRLLTDRRRALLNNGISRVAPISDSADTPLPDTPVPAAPAPTAAPAAASAGETK